ncbi:DUF2235 domain-containing protein [Abyssibius alkaniclasticus]|uniref:DUF2235 domain-containing protein n=1 Tax=Abyssibius alkaniclasticus TaxID=2881234 RepID=UPI00236496FD|nr:DUF2235 domain-containing protein [Abyssibius alkaniclasticus]UPH69848.1 DUF2235 domain-containing protein [Abyssibius alkaniclasticus]
MSSAPKTHVYVIDGTLSRMDDGQETNAGLLVKLLNSANNPDICLKYDPGVQGRGWRKWLDVASGLEVNQSITQGYRHLCEHYRPGDRIMLFGYSRGAYAVRSIAGLIDRVGLIRAEHVNTRRVEMAYRYYQTKHLSRSARVFTRRYTHRFAVNIELIGCWDTVKALGLPYPILSRLAPMVTDFHNHQLSPLIRNAFQALALDENRSSYTPIPWRPVPGWSGHMEQVWFAGAHADVGGQVQGAKASRPLSNIPLVWMLERAARCGLPLPDGWRARFETDATAPMLGPYAGVSRFFLYREPRYIRAGRGDRLHASVSARMQAIPHYWPTALGVLQTPLEPALEHSQTLLSKAN